VRHIQMPIDDEISPNVEIIQFKQLIRTEKIKKHHCPENTKNWT